MINQLSAAGAKFEVLPVTEGKRIVRLFIDSFIKNEKREMCRLNLARPIIAQKPVDYHKYFLPRNVKDVGEIVSKETLVRWLGRGRKWHSHLFFSEPWIDPIIVDLSSFKDASLSLFLDSYWLNLDTGRLIVLTRDGETILCEMKETKR